MPSLLPLFLALQLTAVGARVVGSLAREPAYVSRDDPEKCSNLFHCNNILSTGGGLLAWYPNTLHVINRTKVEVSTMCGELNRLSACIARHSSTCRNNSLASTLEHRRYFLSGICEHKGRKLVHKLKTVKCIDNHQNHTSFRQWRAACSLNYWSLVSRSGELVQQDLCAALLAWRQCEVKHFSDECGSDVGNLHRLVWSHLMKGSSFINYQQCVNSRSVRSVSAEGSSSDSSQVADDSTPSTNARVPTLRVEQDCSYYRACNSLITTRGGGLRWRISTLNLATKTEEEVETMCEDLDNFTNCLNQRERFCDNFWDKTSLNSKKTYLRAVCQPEVRRLLRDVTGSQCEDNSVYQSSISGARGRCCSSFYSELSVRMADSSQYTIGPEFCPYINSWRSCEVGHVNSLCGRNIGRLHEVVWDVKTGRTLYPAGCPSETTPSSAVNDSQPVPVSTHST